MSLRLSDYQYHLPEERIAQSPAPHRDGSRLMRLRRSDRNMRHLRFAEILDVLGPDDFLVCNDTKVFPARLFGRRTPGGGRVEILLLRELEPGTWRAMVRPARKLPVGAVVDLEGGGTARITDRDEEGLRRLEIRTLEPWNEFLARHGVTPLPPYIHRQGDTDETFHRARYQTVYAQTSGSVAAPTAGLHFTPELLAGLAGKGVGCASVTLHVGMGTFKPVTVDDVSQHRMDEEYYTLEPAAAEAIGEARAAGKRIVAVGTTTTRALESIAARHDGALPAGSGWTGLFITPGFPFRVIGGLLTNFHLPGSTLLMLVSAFAGREWVLSCYEEAVRREYRFYSYGDCMLIL